VSLTVISVDIEKSASIKDNGAAIANRRETLKELDSKEKLLRLELKLHDLNHDEIITVLCIIDPYIPIPLKELGAVASRVKLLRILKLFSEALEIDQIHAFKKILTLDTFMTRLSDDLTRNDLGYVMQLDLFPFRSR